MKLLNTARIGILSLLMLAISIAGCSKKENTIQGNGQVLNNTASNGQIDIDGDGIPDGNDEGMSWVPGMGEGLMGSNSYIDAEGVSIRHSNYSLRNPPYVACTLTRRATLQILDFKATDGTTTITLDGSVNRMPSKSMIGLKVFVNGEMKARNVVLSNAEYDDNTGWIYIKGYDVNITTIVVGVPATIVYH